jgi:DNA repair protein RadC
MSATIVPLHRASWAPESTRKSPHARQEAVALDPETLSDTDLLGLVIGRGAGKEAAAHDLLARFGSLHGIERAAVSELLQVRGLGPRRAATLKAALALGRRAACTERRRGERIRSAADVFRRLSPLLRHLDREVFLVLLLDNRHRVLREVRVAEGGLTACAVQPRDVLEPAVREGAAAVIFVHNHPSGDPTPSKEDVALTQRLGVGAEALGIRALDHVVVGDGRYVSLADRGLMSIAR